MRSHFASRLRSASLSAVPPPRTSRDYSPDLAIAAASILYRSPLPSPSGLPLYVLNAAALPDTHEVDYDALLPYVLARLPGEEELIGGRDYEVVFFAGGDGTEGTGGRKGRPGWGWFVQAYHVLSRAMRKRIQKLYIVHERSWVRVLTEVFSSIVSPKFRRKIAHVSTLSSLALRIPIENLLIPPSAYLHDRRLASDVYAPYATGRRAFSARNPFPRDYDGNSRLPRVLRETTSFILHPQNIKTEGLFRIPAHSKLRGALREAYDRGQKYIVWKDNGVTLPVPNYPGAGDAVAIIREVEESAAYNVHMAAALCKMWYSELKQPLFPQSCYRDLKTIFGEQDPQKELSQESVVEFINPDSKWSSVPQISREILMRHLLPMLFRVASYQEENKMTSMNLATCFAPALLCGPDQIEDAKMSTIIRRILVAAVDTWESGSREKCGVKQDALERDLQPPPRIEDYEDPLDEPAEEATDENHELGTSNEQSTGIILQDNDNQPTLSSTTSAVPPLPPRPSPSSSRFPGSGSADDGTMRRKPAPPTIAPPRYSTIISDHPVEVSQSPTSWAATTDGFAPHRPRPGPSSAGGIETGGLGGIDEGGKHFGTTHWTSISDSKQRGINGVADNAQPRLPSVNVAKRKGLTSEQIDRVEQSCAATVPSRQPSTAPPRYSQLPPEYQERETTVPRRPNPLDTDLPRDSNAPATGLAQVINSAEAVRRKPVPSSREGPEKSQTDPSRPSRSQVMPASAGSRQSSAPLPSVPNSTRSDSTQTNGTKPPTQSPEFAKPTWPASAPPHNRHATAITSLARPVYPTASPTNLTNAIVSNNAYPSFRRTSTPTLTSSPSALTPTTEWLPKPRAPSPGLLHRMPSFEPQPAGELIEPKRLPNKLRKRTASMEELRRVYEQRNRSASSFRTELDSTVVGMPRSYSYEHSGSNEPRPRPMPVRASTVPMEEREKDKEKVRSPKKLKKRTTDVNVEDLRILFEERAKMAMGLIEIGRGAGGSGRSGGRV